MLLKGASNTGRRVEAQLKDNNAKAAGRKSDVAKKSELFEEVKELLGAIESLKSSLTESHANRE